jgi:hypothetical protein
MQFLPSTSLYDITTRHLSKKAAFNEVGLAYTMGLFRVNYVYSDVIAHYCYDITIEFNIVPGFTPTEYIKLVSDAIRAFLVGEGWAQTDISIETDVSKDEMVTLTTTLTYKKSPPEKKLKE